MTAATVSGAPKASIAHRLYEGELAYDFNARRKRWYTISAAILVISVVALLVRGLNLGIDFKGGSTYEAKLGSHTVTQVKEALASAGVTDPEVQTLSDGDVKITTIVQTNAEVATTTAALAKTLGVTENQTNPSTIGPTWGDQIRNKAIEGLVAFLVLVSIGLSIRFEPKMAVAAFVALLHDMVITVGVYALVGFEVTPATVVAFLTILGFSLYDTVVVFDRVRETTAGLQSNARITYSQASNQALNQTLMRSINTSVIALLPVIALLVVGAGLLGAGTLKDLALAQLIGLIAGAYSSIFIATPLLAQLKERELPMQQLRAKIDRAEAAGKIVDGRRLTGAERAAMQQTGTGDAAAEPAADAAPKPAGGATQRRVDPKRNKKRPGGRR